MQFVARLENFTLLYDPSHYNYKISDGHKIIAYPSTEEDAFRRLRMYTGKVEFSDAGKCWTGCPARSCNDCEKYNY